MEKVTLCENSAYLRQMPFSPNSGIPEYIVNTPNSGIPVNPDQIPTSSNYPGIGTYITEIQANSSKVAKKSSTGILRNSPQPLHLSDSGLQVNSGTNSGILVHSGPSRVPATSSLGILGQSGQVPLTSNAQGPQDDFNFKCYYYFKALGAPWSLYEG